jgi:hypothetical protein
MRVSSALRIEAKKLFWGDPDTYYLIKSDWIFDGAHPGNTHYEQLFFPYVQNIEVEHHNYTDDKIALLQLDGESDIQYNAVRDFWNTLRRKFPRLKNVIFNQNGCSISYRKHNGIISYCLRILIESCPPNIDVSVDVLEYEIPVFENNAIALPTNIWQRSLYQQPTVDGEWRKAKPNPNRKTILIPTRRFNGPVGEFENIGCMGTRLYLQYVAIIFLVVEAIDRHYFDKEKPEPFSCLESGCDVYFEKAGQWTLHALRAHHLYMLMPVTERVPEYLVAILPKELGEKFRRHENKVIGRMQDLSTEIERMSDKWNEEGGKKRRDIESRWIDQLENDETWNTGTEARESKLWKHFTMAMGTASWGMPTILW